MSPVVNQAIILDLLNLIAIALVIGVGVYQGIRLRTGLAWHGEGNVLARPFNGSDAALGICFFVFYYLIAYNTGGAPTPAMEPSQYVVGIVFSCALFLLICGALCAYMVILRDLSPVEMFGLRQLPFQKVITFAAIWFGIVLPLIFVVSYLVSLGLTALGMEDQPQELVKLFKESSSPSLKIAIGLSAVLVAPLAEELIFRGFLYGVLKRFTDRWFALVISALLFAVVHHHVGSSLQLFVLAVAMTLAYEASGSLWVPILMHAAFNGLSIARLFFVSGN